MRSYSSALFFIALLLICSSCARKETQEYALVSLNLIDREGVSETITSKDRLKKYDNVDFLSSQPYQKVLRVYNRNIQGENPAFVTSYHPNGQLHQYLEILNGRAWGSYREWYANGQQKIEATTIGGEADITTSAEKSWLFDGCCYVWDEQGNLQAEIPYTKGVLEGVSIYYHPNANIAKTIPFTHNSINGTYMAYSPEGALLMTAEFIDSLQEGPAMQYRTNGQICSEELFCEGLLMEGRYFDINRSLTSEIKDGNGCRTLFKEDYIAELQEFRHGLLEGQVQVFNPKGQLVKIYHLKNGLKHGEEIEYYASRKKSDTLVPKISINWFDDKIQGLVKTWYENGIQESQREMSQNAKNGVATAWYIDGSLMLIEEYDRNKLVRGEYYRKGEKTPASLITKGKGTVTLFDASGNFIRKVNYIGGMPLD
jgi:antitoxin component YwqK of YwqJK toxin-antitoxin module